MSAGRVLVYGGRGALGSHLVTNFKAAGWWVVNLDIKPSEAADQNVIVDTDHSWAQQEDAAKQSLSALLEGDKLDAVLCMAGGWAGGSPASKDFIKNADLMWKSSVWPASIAASLATQHLREGGMVVLPGAAPAVAGTPTMAGYGMAKAAVHQLTKSLACSGSGLPTGCLVTALLPVTLDTPMNRKWMAKADTSTWTPLEYVSSLLLGWAGSEERPPNGSLVKMVTEEGKTHLVFV